MPEKIIELMQKYSWILLVLILILGWFYPILMLLTFICMIGPVVFSFVYGRAWCGNFCPRGSLNSYVLKIISPNKKIPSALKHPLVRIIIFVLLITLFVSGIIQAKGSMMGIGIAFIKMMTLTTLIEICMAVFIHQNSWCYICPMGSVASMVNRFKGRAAGEVCFAGECDNCSKCAEGCPMQINIPKYYSIKSVKSSDCIKCRGCIKACPNNVLKWEME